MNYYYANEKDEPVGPCTAEQMRQLYQQGTIQDDTWVLQEGAKKWSEHEKLFPPTQNPSAVPSVPAPPASPAQSAGDAFLERVLSIAGICLGVLCLLYVNWAIFFSTGRLEKNEDRKAKAEEIAQDGAVGLPTNSENRKRRAVETTSQKGFQLLGGLFEDRKAKAKRVVILLCCACEAYELDMNKRPVAQSLGDLVLILNGLRDPRTGKDLSGERPDLLKENPEKLRCFLNDFMKDPTVFGQDLQAPLTVYDPWGTPYAFCIDNGHDGIYFRGPGNTEETAWRNMTGNKTVGAISLPFGNRSSELPIFGKWAFFSNGPDRRTGTASTSRDDIRSWD